MSTRYRPATANTHGARHSGVCGDPSTQSADTAAADNMPFAMRHHSNSPDMGYRHATHSTPHRCAQDTIYSSPARPLSLVAARSDQPHTAFVPCTVNCPPRERRYRRDTPNTRLVPRPVDIAPAHSPCMLESRRQRLRGRVRTDRTYTRDHPCRIPTPFDPRTFRSDSCNTVSLDVASHP